MRRKQSVKAIKQVNLLYFLSYYFCKFRIRSQIIFWPYNPEELLKKKVSGNGWKTESNNPQIELLNHNCQTLPF